jgi:two-component system cell cycle response regulator
MERAGLNAKVQGNANAGNGWFRPVAIGAAAFVLLYALLLALRPGSERVFIASDDILGFAGPLVGAGLVLARGARLFAARKWSLSALGPALLGLGIFLFALGDGVWAWYEQVLGRESPFPSVADIAYLTAYPCLLLGILLLPAARVRGAGRIKAALDGALVVLVAGTFSWHFLLVPTFTSSDASAWATALGVAYPAADVLLIACLMLLSARAGAARQMHTLGLVTVGLATVVLADTVFDYLTLRGGYATGNFITDLGWLGGYLLIILGATSWQDHLAQAGAVSVPAAEARVVARPARVWIALLPYVVLPPLGMLVIHIWRTSTSGLAEQGVLYGSMAAVACVLARQLLALLENGRLQTETAAYAQRLEQLATTDPLTELPNHRATIAALEREVERAQRTARPFVALFIDLDHFKALNDAYGHSAGDSVLREFAAVARGTLRSMDVFGRWGGEEFLAILPETDAAAAAGAAERLRAAVASHRFAVGGGIHLTCSVGLAEWAPPDSADQLVAAADGALYAAKHLGRNQIRAADDPAVAAVGGLGEGGSRESAMLTGAAEALAALVAARDSCAGAHMQEVGALALQVALACGLKAAEAHMLGLAGRLHDIGKVAVPDAILHRAGPLSEAEWAIIRTHPAVGAQVIECIPALRPIAPLVRAHHERWDGAGYPDQLAGAAIPFGARVLAAVDAYAAITIDRPYRRAQSPARAMAELRRHSGAQFDPTVVEALDRVLAMRAEALDNAVVRASNSNVVQLRVTG